jgi:hypothetical protein
MADSTAREIAERLAREIEARGLDRYATTEPIDPASMNDLTLMATVLALRRSSPDAHALAEQLVAVALVWIGHAKCTQVIDSFEPIIAAALADAEARVRRAEDALAEANRTIAMFDSDYTVSPMNMRTAKESAGWLGTDGPLTVSPDVEMHPRYRQQFDRAESWMQKTEALSARLAAVEQERALLNKEAEGSYSDCEYLKRREEAALGLLRLEAAARLDVQRETHASSGDATAVGQVLKDRLAAVEQALRKLRQEVAGSLAIAENDLRYVLGNTNLAVLKLRVDEASAALGDPQ